jgi:plasmid maintenance system antidote protein VapI
MSPEYITCPECGAGWGRPHFMRCVLIVPAYDRPVGIRQIQGLAAYAIGIFPLDTVRREVIRAMLPRGDRRMLAHPETRRAGERSRNAASHAYREALKYFDETGWIWRTPERIHITRNSRPKLLRYAHTCLPTGWDLTDGVHESVADLIGHLPGATPAGIDDPEAERERELAALRRLMEKTPASGPHGGQGWVRIVPRPGRPELSEGERPRIPREWNPDWAAAPGDTLRDWLEETGLTVSTIAGRCRDRIAAAEAIRDVFEHRPLTPDYADLLGEATGIPARLWLRTEAIYRRDLAAGRKDAPGPFPLPGEERRD